MTSKRASTAQPAIAAMAALRHHRAIATQWFGAAQQIAAALIAPAGLPLASAWHIGAMIG